MLRSGEAVYRSLQQTLATLSRAFPKHVSMRGYGAMMRTETLTGGGSSKSIIGLVITPSSGCGRGSRFLRQDLSVY